MVGGEDGDEDGGQGAAGKEVRRKERRGGQRGCEARRGIQQSSAVSGQSKDPLGHFLGLLCLDLGFFRSPLLPVFMSHFIETILE